MRRVMDLTDKQVREVEVIISEVRDTYLDIERLVKQQEGLRRQLDRLKARADELLRRDEDPVQAAERQRRLARDRYLGAVRGQQLAQRQLEETWQVLLDLQEATDD